MYVPNYYLRYMSLPVDIEIINVHSLPQIAWTTDLWRMDSVTFFGKYFYGCIQQFQHQFYLQSVYKPHFTHEFFCLGHLGSSGSKEKKVNLSFSEQLLRVFFQLFVGKPVHFFIGFSGTIMKLFAFFSERVSFLMYLFWICPEEEL